jgi:flavin reductase (DIM6/NTAB) family NADH-FMN oxidoreductase RutF
MSGSIYENVVALSAERPFWEQVFTVAPLVVIGTNEENGRIDFAPKHMAMPIGWGNYFGFACTPRHSTYHNINRAGEFTVSFPRPNQVVLATLTASNRDAKGNKQYLENLPTFAAKKVNGRFLKDSYLFLECEHNQTINGFDDFSLIIGNVVAAYAGEDSVRVSDQDPNDLLAEAPLLAYLNWGRYAPIKSSYSFPFLKDFKR